MIRTFLTLFLIFLLNGASAQTGSFLHNGFLRTYIVHLPPAFVPGTPVPLVINLHGFGSNAAQQEFYSQFDAVADTAGFIVVYPNAVDSTWDTLFLSSAIDDVGFISELIDTLNAKYSIDTARVYSTGMSMGGFMTYRLACELSSRIAAVASVAGPVTDSVLYLCGAAKHLPVLHIHGTADSTVQYNGNIFYPPVDSIIKYFVQKNNCPAAPVITQLPDINTSDSSTATRSYYGLCQDSAEVILYTINNGGHTWPGAFPILSLGNTNQDFIASGVIWNFFNKHRLNEGITAVPPIAGSSVNEITVYPNPFGNGLTVKSSHSGLRRVEIFSVLGTKLAAVQSSAISADETEVFIPLGGLKPGFYLLTAETVSGISYHQIMKTGY